MNPKRERDALHAIMRDVSYLPRWSRARRIIEQAAGERLRELRPDPVGVEGGATGETEGE